MFDFKEIKKLSQEFDDERQADPFRLLRTASREFDDERQAAKGFWAEYLRYVEEEVDNCRAADGGLTNAACDTLKMAAWYCRNKAAPKYEEYFDQDSGTQRAAELFDYFYEDYFAEEE